MSFILDALRKSEHARQHLGGATLAELPLGRRQRSQPWWVIALAALLLVNLIVLSIVLLRKNPEPSVVNPISIANDQNTNSVRTARAPAPATVVPPPLAEEAAQAPAVQYETIPRSESPFATAVPEGPPLVKPIESAAVRDAVPLTTANGLPELRIDMHVYAKDPKERFVFINARKYTEGQALSEGPRVAEITSDGVILFYLGQTLHMPRP